MAKKHCQESKARSSDLFLLQKAKKQKQKQVSRNNITQLEKSAVTNINNSAELILKIKTLKSLAKANTVQHRLIFALIFPMLCCLFDFLDEINTKNE